MRTKNCRRLQLINPNSLKKIAHKGFLCFAGFVFLIILSGENYGGTITKYVKDPDGGFSIYNGYFLFILSENKDTIAYVMMAIGALIIFVFMVVSYFRRKGPELLADALEIEFTFWGNLRVKVNFKDISMIIGTLLIVFGAILRTVIFVSGATI